MNAHFPQNVLAETELRHLAAIPYQIVSPAGSSPIIGIYQDSLLGSYRFTRSKIDFKPRDAMNMLMMYPSVDTSKIIDKSTISNFEILSQIMPPITMVSKTKLFEDGEDYMTSNNVLEIRNGEYKRGQIEKSVLGSSTKGIIHRAYNDFGNNKAADFIDDLQNIVTEYMKTSSYSVGISDLIADKKTTTDIIKVIADKKLEVKQLMDNIHLGIFKNETANSNLIEFENRVNNTMKQADNETGKIGRKSLSQNNRFLMIVNSGSKGSLINIAQMISCLGQQNVDGKRIPYGFDSRTLPHYSKFDDSPNARGYIENSYISGLTAPELFFHAMGGRIGLIDTAVKTSQTGYIQRRLIKGLEDLKVEYDMTVRNSKGKIIQFAYGDDNMDSTKVEHQNIPLVAMSVEDIYMMYDIIGVNSNEKNLLDVYTKGAVNRIKKQKQEAMKMCQQYIKNMVDYYMDDLVNGIFKNTDDNRVKIPVSFQNIINNIQGSLGLSANSVVDITPLECFELMEEYYEKIKSLYFAPPKKLFRIMYLFYLNPRDLLCIKRFHRKAIIVLLETIVLKYKQAIVHPGEMVGVIAGQSIGEPTTQLTLNSVTYETEIIVRDANHNVHVLQIGDFVKEWIEKSMNIQYNKEKDTTYAELNTYYEVPSATEEGETKWCRIEAVTKHPVVNEDGTNTMLKIKTKGCREVIITKAKSVLQLVDGKIQEVSGSDLKIGEYLPVSKKTIETLIQIKSNIDAYFKYDYCKMDNYVPNKINGCVVLEERNNRFSDIEFDEIISIEEVENTTSYAYDLTVEHTRNFDIANGLCLRDTFHLAGVASKSNVTRGVPRIEEILRLTKNPKKSSLTVFLKHMDEDNMEKASNFANMVEHTRLMDVVSSIQICFDPMESQTNIAEDKLLMEHFYEFEKWLEECDATTSSSVQQVATRSKWILRMEMDSEILLDKNITMDDIHFAIKNSVYGNDIHCVYSDYNSDKLIFRIRLNGDVFNKSKKRGVSETLDQSDEIYLLKNFQDNILNNIVLRGVNGIEKVLPRKLQNMVVKKDGKYMKKDTWVLDTTGTNLLDTLALDYIDYKRTISNDIKEVFDILGIEAARQTIYNELVEVMEASDVSIDYHHTSLLCDRMTCNQNMVSIFRTGILSDNIGPIAKSTFEVHTEVLLDAARHGEFDHMKGVSANVMCGQYGYYGTNAFQLVLDLKQMEKLDGELSEAVDKVNEIDVLFGKMELENDMCPRNNIEIKNNVENIKRNKVGLCNDDYNMGF